MPSIRIRMRNGRASITNKATEGCQYYSAVAQGGGMARAFRVLTEKRSLRVRAVRVESAFD
ncbi:MAG TPA: hypothetical protein VE842_11690 [Pyrinomonadaceae bacterium]|jgi:hypothetical protein|nr:hypothetical protein [Pyrinomonadaceae bacterium]